MATRDVFSVSLDTFPHSAPSTPLEQHRFFPLSLGVPPFNPQSLHLPRLLQ